MTSFIDIENKNPFKCDFKGKSEIYKLRHVLPAISGGY